MIERSLGSSTRILDPVPRKGDPTETPPSGHLTTAHRCLSLPLLVADGSLGSDCPAGSSGKRIEAGRLRVFKLFFDEFWRLNDLHEVGKSLLASISTLCYGLFLKSIKF
ncbi:hypothetical protein RchiOBHm_Chr4g0416911 [Rosa chinensis]|uniref:Uncharacterized protein n=1 Tax=Rosa chinensis TaxID=74649 RepID=A0A2P6QWZ6_ROSCH|nr:hypothetical protein RchiOBHm_Chr4g0416911 [Rosa chinensis]